MTILKNSFIVFFFLLYGQSYGQNFHPKAYAASVRIWGFDTLKKVQTSAQFSGVVVSGQGHILTAAHVNQPGNTYLVTFPNGKSHIAVGLGEIEFAENKRFPDVAVMKMTGADVWPYAEMGWSSSLKVGEPCLSIAYPETLNQPLPTIRFGRITNKKNEFGFIQSTCIMEPGDSGGPLFDQSGRVIALHSAIGILEDENYEIPVDLYRKYWTALNIPKTYSSFPSVQDAVGTDPHRSTVMNGLDPLKDQQPGFAGLPAHLKQSCLRISSVVNGKAQQINGTLFSMSAKSGGTNGSFVISKSSLIGDHPVVLAGNKSIALKVISRDSENDLVLLQSLSTIKGGISLKQFNRDSLSFQDFGKFLISPQSVSDSQISMVGSLYFKSPKRFSIGYLGAMATFKAGNIVITAVQPGSPAELSGIVVGDRILSVNGAVINKPEDYGAELMKFWPDDQLTFGVKHLDSLSSKQLTLGVYQAPLSAHPAEQFPGGKSIRRDGFSQVFSHDAKIKPDECGGPVFDINHRFYGINIARFSRAAALVIPANVILRLMEKSQSL